MDFRPPTKKLRSDLLCLFVYFVYFVYFCDCMNLEVHFRVSCVLPFRAFTSTIFCFVIFVVLLLFVEYLCTKPSYVSGFLL